MKKWICLCLAMLLCLLSAAGLAEYVPTSASKLPAMPSAPDAPRILRLQRADGAMTLTLDWALPSPSRVTCLGRDADCQLVAIAAASGEDGVYSAEGLPDGGWWTGVEIAWADVRAEYNAAGGLARITRYDRAGNEYVFDGKGRFIEFGYAASSVRARFNTRGVMTSYGYEAFRDVTVWFSRDSDVMYAEYNDGNFAATWEPGYGWFVRTPEGDQKVKLSVSPWNARALLKKPEAGEEEEATEVIHYPKNTICVAGLTLQEASDTLPDKWYNVLPVDLTRDGRQTYSLMISNMFYIGKVYVDVWGDEVTVDYSLIDSSAIRPLSEYGRWFTSLSDITSASIESDENGFGFGQPVSISEDLGGADVALLFIRSKATYYQPFRDGTTLTRYWRNLPEWKEFREGLQELMLRVEK